ncbi:hypothetical protein RvY_10465 [Ramazzottius varieornatus]|uniref:Uncharacterized protein n=1 Tax=Ramazzottius varieornatus TaxID=947166 RepID=A0A1D1VF99_RAMVA|nr:hypothetical protein RvY_10465 [Ramazzottius varieornatus]
MNALEAASLPVITTYRVSLSSGGLYSCPGMASLLRWLPSRATLSLSNDSAAAKLIQKGKDFKPMKFVINVAEDYVAVTKDALLDAKSRPVRTIILLSGLAVAAVAFKTTPSEIDYFDGMRNFNNDLIQVPPSSRRPESEKYLINVQRLLNSNRLRYENWGLCSLIVHKEFNESCDTYEARCKYLKPSWFSLPERVVDVGCFNRWLNIDSAMKDFDVVV